MVEIWKDIEGYEGLYQVSSIGRIKSLHKLQKEANGYTQSDNFLKPRRQSGGYLFVDLYDNGRHKRYYIHRLVAIYFIPNPNNLPEVNHKDEDKTNNQVCNLEWCNRRYNACYGSKLNRTKNTCIRNNIYSKILDKRDELGSYGARKKVAMCDIDGNILKVFPSMSEASREIGVNVGKICECCQGKRTKTRNYKWKYYGEN